MKVLVIGLDGATLDLIKPWAQDGKLPTFAKIMSEGSYGPLRSTIPSVTIPAWNCLSSGKNPGKIGIFGFMQKNYGSRDLSVHASSVGKERDVWDILNDYGKKVFILDAPNVLNAYKINGYMVAGFLCAVDDKLTYPKSFREELKSLGYEKEKPEEVFSKLMAVDDNEIATRYEDITNHQFKVLSHLLDKTWDFGFIVFTGSDRLQHKLWDKKDIILNYYQNIDSKLNGIINKINQNGDKTNLLIVSDHGFGPNERTFFINEHLKNRGFLVIKSIKKVEIIKALVSVLRKPIISKNIQKIVNPLLKFSFFEGIYANIFQNAGRIPISWDETKAFGYGNWGLVYINLENREPHGIVKEEEYESLRKDIIDGLEKISIKAYRREELYSGDYLKLAPDIIVDTDDFVNLITARVGGFGKEFIEGGYSVRGSHRVNGTFIAWGPEINNNLEINAKIYDIAPTILHMFGTPIPKDMDGRVLKEIFKEDSTSFHRDILYQENGEDFNKKNLIKNRIRTLKSMKRI